jgi:perosamine synthetase
MTISSPEFRIPQEPFLSRSFLSLRELKRSNLCAENGARRYFVFWARNAIYHSLRIAKLAPGDEVLVPAYICKVVPEAIRGCGAKIVFYRVDRDCRPDFSDLESRISTRTRAMVVVHFFGFPQPISRLRQFCWQHNLFLIEDCSHVLHSEADGVPLGTFGDVSLFSFRKFYPLYDGGELVLNLTGTELDVEWRHENPLFTLRVAMDLLDQMIGRATNPVLRLPYRLLESFRKPVAQLLRYKTNSEGLSVHKTDAMFDLRLVNYPMSHLSRLVLQHSNASEIAAKRRENYAFLQDELSRIEGLRFLIPSLPSGVCPWVFPLFFERIPEACQALRELGIPATTWEGVRPLELALDFFPDAEYLYNNLVFLPIHQNLKVEDLKKIVEATKKIHAQSLVGWLRPLLSARRLI